MVIRDIPNVKENTVIVPSKTVLFKENDFSKDIYIVKRGKIRILKKIGSRQVQLMTVEAGGIFGEISMFDNGPRTATAVAAEDTELIKMTPALFSESLKKVPEWFMAIARVLSQRIRQTDSRLGLSGPVVNEVNVSAILLYLASGSKDNEGMILSEVEKTLSALLNIPINEMEIVFASLVKKKVVELTADKIKVSSVESLTEHLAGLRNQLSQSFII
ncbi:MAG: Crp/Fnr family transcriptional regulator [Fibrobacteres bacterium]|nr:Crp/Fnr family transcriptional regulator [Fibrobacterota bacterium]